MLASYNSQTYQNKRLFVLDSGREPADFQQDNGIYGEHMPHMAGETIGELRNCANAYAHQQCLDGEIIAHLDVDDWSHPRRIEEQVALLRASGKQCVGFKDMLFYDTTPGQFCGAWLYRHPTKPLGTSLMYWREVWEQRPFPDLPKVKGGTGEEVQWLEGLEHLAVSSYMDQDQIDGFAGHEPRMIASIHGGNTQYYNPAESERLSEGTSWKRAAEWDEYCRETMAL